MLNQNGAPTSEELINNSARLIRMRWLAWLAVAVFVHLTGGIESPAIAFFLFHVLWASILLPRRTAFVYAGFVIGVVAVIAGFEIIGWLPPHDVLPVLPAALYRRPPC